MKSRLNTWFIRRWLKLPCQLRHGGPDPSFVLCMYRCLPALQGGHSHLNGNPYFYGLPTDRHQAKLTKYISISPFPFAWILPRGVKVNAMGVTG